MQAAPAVDRAPRRAPRPVARAVVLMLARGVVGALWILVSLVERDAVERRVLLHTAAANRSSVDAVFVVVLLIEVAITLAYVGLARHVRRGRPAARVAVWLVATVGIVTLLGTLSQPTLGVLRVLALLAGLLDAATALTLAAAPSRGWFRDGFRPPSRRPAG